MEELDSPFTIGATFQRYGRLSMRPLCIYSSDKVPEGAIPAPSLNRCIARAILRLAKSPAISSIFLDELSSGNLCPGGRGWLAYRPISRGIKYMVSAGKSPKGTGLTPNSVEKLRESNAEFLLASPEAVESLIEQVGRITPIQNFLVITPCSLLQGEEIDGKAVLCLGTAEQIRNLSALAHFRASDVFHQVLMPFGPACLTLLGYAAGMAENAPKNAAYVGPVDPTHNKIFPPDCLGLSIPMQIAREMAADASTSFLAKRAATAFYGDESIP